MKAYIVLSLFFVVVTSKPAEILHQPIAITGSIIAPISSQFHSQDNLGQYSYGYTDEHSSKVEVKTLDGITRGGYNYIDAEGKLQSVQYTSDANGFHVDATNLPIAAQLQEIHTVEETPDTVAARTQHSEDGKQAKIEEDEPIIEKISQTPIPPASIPIPSSVRLQNPAFLAPLPVHTFAPLATVRVATPGLAYSYGIPSSSVSYSSFTTHPLQAQITYSTPIIATKQLIGPIDTPEVAKAKAEHLAIVEEVKARNA